MKKIAGFFSLACIAMFVIALFLFLIFIYPNQPIARILLYHSVMKAASSSEPVISIDLFKRQLDYLSAHGYKPVFLKTVIQRHKTGRTIPSSWVVLTFDGGYGDFYTNVYPLLKIYKFRATLFPITSSIGQEGNVTWGQLEEMQDSGLVEIGSHSHNHYPPTCLALPDSKKEKTLSKAILEKKLGTRIVSYAYPYGAVNAQVEEMVKEAEYEGAVGTAYRLGEFKLKDVYNLRRIYVSEYSKLPLMFRFMLSGHYVPARGLILRVLNIKAPRDVNDCADWKTG